MTGHKIRIFDQVGGFDLHIPEGDYETIAGYITNTIGRIPVKGESIPIDHFTFVILRSSNTKVDLVKMFVDPLKLDDLRNLD